MSRPRAAVASFLSAAMFISCASVNHGASPRAATGNLPRRMSAHTESISISKGKTKMPRCAEASGRARYLGQQAHAHT